MTTAELPPLEVGEDNSKTKTLKNKKISSPSFCTSKRLLYGVLGMLCPNMASILC